MSGKQSGWTLFLDRDGVINHRLPGDYVKSWAEFIFMPGVLSALAHLNNRFDHLVMVTNQQGIAKGLMTEQDLSTIHHRMRKMIRKHRGRIDAVYHCSASSDQVPSCRKPEPYMGIQAKKDFPTIDFKQSVLVGDSVSDIEFGKNLNMITVYVNPLLENPGEAAYVCKDLMEFCRIFDRSIRVQ